MIDGLSQEVVHPRRHRLVSIRLVAVGCATANVGDGHVCRSNHTSKLNRDFWAVHFWHAVVEKYDLVHGRALFYNLYYSLFDEAKSDFTTYGGVRRYKLISEQGSHDLDIHEVIVDNKDEGPQLNQFFFIKLSIWYVTKIVIVV